MIPRGAAVLSGALVFALIRQGAYHQWQLQVFAVLAGIAALVLATEQRGRPSLLFAAFVVLPLLASTTLSWSTAADRSDAASTFLAVALVGVGLAAGLSIDEEQRQTAVFALIGLALIVAGTAVWGVVFHSTPWGRVTEGVWRGSSSLTYANAAAAVTGPIALLAFTRAVHTGSRVLAMSTVALMIGFAATQSRGGAAALLVAGFLVIGHLGLRQFSRGAIPVLVGLVIGTPLLLSTASTTASSRPWLVFALIALALAVTAALWPRVEQIAQPAGWLGAAVVLTGVIAVTTGLADPITERLTLRSGTTAQGQDAEVVFGDRGKEWSTAWDRFTEAPALGNGPGVVELRWEEAGRFFRADFVHNEYLELAVTHGIVGLAALAISMWLVARRIQMTAEAWPIVLALVAFLLHSSLDFLWHLPALPVLFAFAAGLAAANGEEHVGSNSPWSRT